LGSELELVKLLLKLYLLYFLQRIANAERLKQLRQELGFPLPATIREEVEKEETADQASQTEAEVSLFDPRGPGGVQGEAAVDAPLPGVPITTL
jgi:hypothetical protein